MSASAEMTPANGENGKLATSSPSFNASSNSPVKIVAHKINTASTETQTLNHLPAA